MTFHIAIYLKHVKSPPSPQTNKKTQTQIHSTESVQRAPSDFLFSSHNFLCEISHHLISCIATLYGIAAFSLVHSTKPWSSEMFHSLTSLHLHSHSQKDQEIRENNLRRIKNYHHHLQNQKALWKVLTASSGFLWCLISSLDDVHLEHCYMLLLLAQRVVLGGSLSGTCLFDLVRTGIYRRVQTSEVLNENQYYIFI